MRRRVASCWGRGRSEAFGEGLTRPSGMDSSLPPQLSPGSSRQREPHAPQFRARGEQPWPGAPSVPGAQSSASTWKASIHLPICGFLNDIPTKWNCQESKVAGDVRIHVLVTAARRPRGSDGPEEVLGRHPSRLAGGSTVGGAPRGTHPPGGSGPSPGPESAGPGLNQSVSRSPRGT